DARDPAKPTLAVCDRANGRLQSFTLGGEFVATTDKGTVLFPANIDTRGDVMLVADLHARLTLLDKELKPIVQLGDDAEWRKLVLGGSKMRLKPKEWTAGKFVHPHDACFDAAGNIYVAEWVVTGRLTFLKKVG
ncbi:MAG: peptidase, partial [Fimbriiglobus sp.]